MSVHAVHYSAETPSHDELVGLTAASMKPKCKGGVGQQHIAGHLMDKPLSFVLLLYVCFTEAQLSHAKENKEHKINQW